MNLLNINKLRSQDQLKFIIKTKNDYIFAKTVVMKYKPRCSVYFQPVWNALKPSQLASWMLKDGLSAKLGLQLHKIVYGEKQGV